MADGRRVAGGALSGAGTGAAVGSMFGPWGTAAGGVGGAIIGGLGGWFGGGESDEERERKEELNRMYMQYLQRQAAVSKLAGIKRGHMERPGEHTPVYREVR